MVYSGKKEGDEGESEREIVMAMEAQRSKPPLHNFNLPFLKWGSQRHLRCMKVPESNGAKDNGSGNGISNSTADRHRSDRLPSKLDNGGFRRPKDRVDGVVGGEEGIEAVREKIIFDLKTAADKMKNAILKKDESYDDDDDDDEEVEEREEEEQSRLLSPALAPAAAAAAAAVAESEQEARPWNLRTRRGACKTLIGGGNSVSSKGLGIEGSRGSNYSPLRGESAKSPGLRAEKREEKERPKFSVALSRKEIEEDFMAMVGHKPPRRPKKRPRAVQKQLDTLFPGLWLTEVTADDYKVPELPDNGKR